MNGILDPEQFPEADQGDAESLVSRIAVGVGPEGGGYLFSLHIPASECYQRLEHLKRLFLDLARRSDRFLIFQKYKSAEGIDLDRPGPVLQLIGIGHRAWSMVFTICSLLSALCGLHSAFRNCIKGIKIAPPD